MLYSWSKLIMRFPLLIGRSRGIDQEYVILSRVDGEGSPVCRLSGILRSFASLRMTVDLGRIYLAALAECAPERLVRRVWRPEMPRNVVAIGKCAGALLDGIPDFDD